MGKWDEIRKACEKAAHDEGLRHGLQSACANGYGDGPDKAGHWRCRCGWGVSPLRSGAADEHIASAVAEAVANASGVPALLAENEEMERFKRLLALAYEDYTGRVDKPAQQILDGLMVAYRNALGEV